MPPAPLCANEAARLQALHDLEILDSSPSDVFDSFVRIARGLFDVPMAAIGLIDADRQWFKAAEGFTLRETTRDSAFCAHAILCPHDILCVPDACQDSRFADLPVVTGPPGIRFYAGMPLVDQDGHALGALCVIDTRPRVPDPAALDHLRDLAIGVMAALRLHAASCRVADEARRDALTGLPNRRSFDAALKVLDRRAATLFMIDLDHFKSINDAFGHSGADAALREVARRLRKVGREADRVFRIGGDAFGCLADGLREEPAAMAVAAQMHAALGAPFAIDGQNVPLRMSVGVATVPLHAKTAPDLVRAADAALFAAKRAGRGTTRLAAARGRHRAGDVGVGRLTMQDALRDALLAPRPEQFDLHFQPVIDLRKGRVTAMEALVRWTLPGGRNVGPADFVQVAEECGLVSHLDRWILRQACAIAARWPMRWRVSVNISPSTVALLDIVALVSETLHHTGLEPAKLMIELTETAAVADTDRMADSIDGLRRLGVLPAVDDFGAGHASLSYLRRYPFVCIKTDRSLVSGLGTDARALPVCEAVVRLSRSLDMLMIAEGVETEEQLLLLHGLSVPKVQGFFLARPVPADQAAGAAERAERRLARFFKRHGLAVAGPGERRIVPVAPEHKPSWRLNRAVAQPLVA
jgi:diguanylate cyclase (GGDEF)-like protein